MFVRRLRSSGILFEIIGIRCEYNIPSSLNTYFKIIIYIYNWDSFRENDTSLLYL